MSDLTTYEDYVMNPVEDELLWSGEDLQTGMVVLVEDRLMRSTLGDSRRTETARWCEVGRIECSPLYDRDDLGRRTSAGSLVEFEAIYSDGVRMKRRYNTSYAWLVKKATIPGGAS